MSPNVRSLAGIAALATVLAAGTASADLTDRKSLTLQAAKAAADGAEAEAKKNNWNVVIAVVDDGGHLIYLRRLDDAQVGSVDIAIGKARTAAQFKRPSKAFEDAVAGGRVALTAIPGVTPLEGGVPILVAGKVIGAVGVSGVMSSQDAQIARAGAETVK